MVLGIGVKFLSVLVEAQKPYLMLTVRIALSLRTCTEVLICIYNLKNGEIFNLCDTFN